MVRIDQYSMTSLPLQMHSQGNILGYATGFFFEEKDKVYLVSNWHVLAGRDPSNGQPRHSSGAVPDEIVLPIHKDSIGTFLKKIKISLYDDDGNAKWIQHPVHGQNVDVAVTDPVILPYGAKHYPLPYRGESTDMIIGVGQELYILGFPKNISAQQILPVWKRASIASEPDLDAFGLPQFLVDTATREGMSGAPVIARAYGGYPTANTAFKVQQIATKFLGIYSGRYGASDIEAQLGRVWWKNNIEEIVKGGIKGTYKLR